MAKDDKLVIAGRDKGRTAEVVLDEILEKTEASKDLERWVGALEWVVNDASKDSSRGREVDENEVAAVYQFLDDFGLERVYDPELDPGENLEALADELDELRVSEDYENSPRVVFDRVRLPGSEYEGLGPDQDPLVRDVDMVAANYDISAVRAVENGEEYGNNATLRSITQNRAHDKDWDRIDEIGDNVWLSWQYSSEEERSEPDRVIVSSLFRPIAEELIENDGQMNYEEVEVEGIWEFADRYGIEAEDEEEVVKTAGDMREAGDIEESVVGLYHVSSGQTASEYNLRIDNIPGESRIGIYADRFSLHSNPDLFSRFMDEGHDIPAQTYAADD